MYDADPIPQILRVAGNAVKLDILLYCLILQVVTGQHSRTYRSSSTGGSRACHIAFRAVEGRALIYHLMLFRGF